MNDACDRVQHLDTTEPQNPHRITEGSLRDPGQAKRIIEALLFVSGQPFTHKRLTEILPDLSGEQIRQHLRTLNEEYAASKRAFQIQEVAGGYQLVTDHQLAPWIKRALPTPQPDA